MPGGGDAKPSVDAEFREILEGLRTKLPGVVVLFSFLLALPLQAADTPIPARGPGKAAIASAYPLASDAGREILANWDVEKSKFLKVFPRDYERMLECFRKVEEQGLSGDEAAMAAFEENLKDLSRVGGN